MNKSLNIDGWPVSYQQFGSGPELLFAFHGYGQSSQIFESFEELLAEKFTIISFDLFYHGQLEGNKLPAAYFSRFNLEQQINHFLKEFDANTFSVMGYSMGGKLALNCLELFAKKLNKIVLMAPDGIKINPFYKFVTHTLVGKKLYRYTIEYPVIIYSTNKLARTIGFINDKVYHFVKNQLKSKENRQKVLDAWLIYSRMLPNINNIAKLINDNKINIMCFFGKYDSIIPAKKGKKLIRKLKNKKAIEILDTGHNLFTERQKIAQYLLLKD